MWRPEIEAGNITRIYNALKVVYQVNDSVKLTFAELMIPQVFKTAGVGAVANPAYQNRLYLIADFDITPKLSLSIPILAYQTKYRDYSADAKNSDSWRSMIYIWPELDYALNENLTLGVAYYSDNLLKSNLSKWTVGDGLEKGAVQFVITTNL